MGWNLTPRSLSMPCIDRIYASPVDVLAQALHSQRHHEVGGRERHTFAVLSNAGHDVFASSLSISSTSPLNVAHYLTRRPAQAVLSRVPFLGIAAPRYAVVGQHGSKDEPSVVLHELNRVAVGVATKGLAHA